MMNANYDEYMKNVESVDNDVVILPSLNLTHVGLLKPTRQLEWLEHVPFALLMRSLYDDDALDLWEFLLDWHPRRCRQKPM